MDIICELCKLLEDTTSCFPSSDWNLFLWQCPCSALFGKSSPAKWSIGSLELLVESHSSVHELFCYLSRDTCDVKYSIHCVAQWELEPGQDLVPALHFPVVSWVAVRLHLHLDAWPSLWPHDVCACCDTSNKEALGGCGSDHLWLLSVNNQQEFITMRPVLFLPTLSPPLCSTCLQTQTPVGVGTVLPRLKAPTCVGAFDPSPAWSPASTMPGAGESSRAGRAM